jgi:hypothetical protein
MLSFQLSMLIAAVEGASMLLKLRAIMLLDVRGKGAAIVNSLFKHFSTYCYSVTCPIALLKCKLGLQQKGFNEIGCPKIKQAFS